MTDWLYAMPNNWTSNISDIAGLFMYVSDVVPIFSALILIVIFSTSFIGLKRYTSERALMPSLFITAVIGTFLFSLGMVEDTWLFFLWFAVAVSYILGHYYQSSD